MGADSFRNVAHGKTAKEAFNSAVEHAAWEHGHGGYSGTIAEKSSFTVIAKADPLQIGVDPMTAKDRLEQAYALSDKLMDSRDPRIIDKWGRAGCIDVGEGTYLFFGWASS